jgi:K+-transporting ATPase ATPase C chain
MLLSFARQSLAGLRILLALTLVTGVLYPLAVLLVGQGLFGDKADGSFVTADGRVVGSSLIGQSVDDPGYFWPRPSAAGEGYDALASSASNLGPENPDLVAQVQQRRADVAAADGVDPADVPPDALTASGSGLDPHISPAYARQQVERVARARGLDAEQVAGLVDAHTQGRQLGFLGEPRVNVLELNLALDGLRG